MNETGIDTCKEPGLDIYEDLRNATPEELLEAMEWFLRQGNQDNLEAQWKLKRTLTSLRLGFQLTQPGGWAHVAPYWLRESRKEKDE